MPRDMHNYTTSRLSSQSGEFLFLSSNFSKRLAFPQAPNSSESPGTSRTEHSDLLEEEEDERSDIKVKQS